MWLIQIIIYKPGYVTHYEVQRKQYPSQSLNKSMFRYKIVTALQIAPKDKRYFQQRTPDFKKTHYIRRAVDIMSNFQDEMDLSGQQSYTNQSIMFEPDRKKGLIDTSILEVLSCFTGVLPWKQDFSLTKCQTPKGDKIQIPRSDVLFSSLPTPKKEFTKGKNTKRLCWVSYTHLNLLATDSC